MRFDPRFAATAIGSLPHRSSRDACALMLDSLSEMPAWPQLPRRSFLENMYVQYTEGLPGIRLDEGAEKVWFETGSTLEDELESFYEAVIEENLDRFAMSGRYAEGLSLLAGGDFSAELGGRPYLKGQVTGPVSFGLTVTDRDKRASLYNETLEQAIVKGLSLKARWQCRALREAAPEASVAIFFDEPYLSSVGSGLMSVSLEQAVEDMKQCVSECDADLVGMHCCGNTDWSLVFRTGVDVINFDAYDYMEGFVAYDEEIQEHMDNGGSVAWGVVPPDERALGLEKDELVGLVEGALDTLAGKGIDREVLARRSMITPGCGLCLTSIEVAEKVLALTGEVSYELRGRYFDR